jgi:hypothetical protein
MMGAGSTSMIRRLFTALALLSLVLAVVAAALWAAVGRLAAPAGPPAPSTDLAQSTLARSMAGIGYTGGRLEELVYFLRSRLPLRVAVDWDGLADAGLAPQTPVDFKDYPGCLGETLTHFAETHGLALASRADRLVLTTRASLDAGVLEQVPPEPGPDPRRAEFVRGADRWTVAIYDGALIAWRTPADPAAAFRPSAAAAMSKQASPATWQAKLPAVTIDRSGYPYDSIRVETRLWALVAASSLVPLLWGVTTMRRRRRRTPGDCPACGYDLRATPERCPECGLASGATS